MKNTISGTLEECLLHFGQVIDKNKDMKQFQELIAVAGGNKDRARDWISGHTHPLGPVKLAVIYFLEARGYLIKELIDVEEFIKDISRLIAFNVVKAEYVWTSVGYGNWDHLGRVLFGKSKGSEEKRDIIKHILSEHQSDVERLRPTVAFSASEKAAVVTNENELKETIIQSFVASLRAIDPLAKSLVSYEFTAEDRARMRKLIGNQFLFELSNNINRLSSPQAFELSPKPKGESHESSDAAIQQQ